MVTVENPGNDLEQTTITINGKTIVLTEESDPKILYLAVEELSRVILRLEKSKDFHMLVQEILKNIQFLTPRRAAIGLTQIDLIYAKLKEKVGEINEFR